MLAAGELVGEGGRGATGEKSALLKGRRVAGRRDGLTSLLKTRTVRFRDLIEPAESPSFVSFFSFHKTLQALSGVDESRI